MKIIFIGDIVGKLGRRAVARVLPDWKKKHQPDMVIANGENLAHGLGFTQSTMDEVLAAGVDFLTTGNHWADKAEALQILADKKQPIIRPANWPGQTPGQGYKIIEVGARPVAIVNLMAQVFMHQNCSSPFLKFDEIIKELSGKTKIIIVDFHGEATSEKRSLGLYADGRVSAMVGTHTHVPTSDVQVLSGGSGYCTDLGMCGARDSVIGADKKNIIARFLDQLPRAQEMPETGATDVNAVIIDIDEKTGKCREIKRLDELVSL